MIRHTFSVLNGIGEKLERKIWKQGILTWDAFCAQGEIEGISPERKGLFDTQLREASAALQSRNAAHFAKMVKRREHWRLFNEFKDHALCLDIETNGLLPWDGGYTTVIGLYDGYDWKHLVHGESLTPENLNRHLQGYKCLITFYGSAFDIPFLLRTLPGVRFDIPHFDLCFAARKLGINGGLKKIETMFGIERPEEVKGMNGYDAVKLWEQHRRGSSHARELLLMYNREDTRNLLSIADALYLKLRQSTGIEDYVTCGSA